MNKARPTMSGSLIKHRAYLKYIIIIIIIIIIVVVVVVVVVLIIIKKKRKKLMRTLRWKINVKIKQ
jgi:threonine/homoserine/homoserine lactone efflux protein